MIWYSMCIKTTCGCRTLWINETVLQPARIKHKVAAKGIGKETTCVPSFERQLFGYQANQKIVHSSMGNGSCTRKRTYNFSKQRRRQWNFILVIHDFARKTQRQGKFTLVNTRDLEICKMDSTSVKEAHKSRWLCFITVINLNTEYIEWRRWKSSTHECILKEMRKPSKEQWKLSIWSTRKTRKCNGRTPQTHGIDWSMICARLHKLSCRSRNVNSSSRRREQSPRVAAPPSTFTIFVSQPCLSIDEFLLLRPRTETIWACFCVVTSTLQTECIHWSTKTKPSWNSARQEFVKSRMALGG